MEKHYTLQVNSTDSIYDFLPLGDVQFTQADRYVYNVWFGPVCFQYHYEIT